MNVKRLRRLVSNDIFVVMVLLLGSREVHDVNHPFERLDIRMV